MVTMLEKVKLLNSCANKKVGVKFEYTAPNTSQQSGRVEKVFYSIQSVHALLNNQNFLDFLRNGLWSDAANTPF